MKTKSKKVTAKSKQEATKQEAVEVLTPLATKYPYLDEYAIKALLGLSKEPENIFQLGVAKVLRGVERKQAEHGDKIIEISTAIGVFGLHDPLPYFSVKLV